jgi:K+-sensing histidine kinase KdpD
LRRSSQRGPGAAKLYAKPSLELLVFEGIRECVGDDLVAAVIGVDAVRQDIGWSQKGREHTTRDELGDLGAEIIRVTGSDVAKELVRVAREKNAGRIVIGHPRRRGLSLLLRGSTAVKLLRLATDVDVQVVAAGKDL